MANRNSLKAYEFTSDQSREKAAQNGRKGGIASGKAKREKANFKKLLEIALNEEYKGEMTNAEAMVVSLIQEALSGNVRAFEVARDTVGQKPVEQVDERISGGITVGWGEKCK